jgi:N utilization substance protein A
VAVFSRERDVDPVGACVGMKGSRVQSIIRELRGEKIDIIEHSDDLVTLAQSALAPARITRVSVTHQGEVPHLDVIVEDEQLSLAIGKRGQNVRLASELLGARIDIKSESDVKDEVTDALARMLQSSVAGSKKAEIGEGPGVTPEIAESLEAAGFGEVETLAEASSEDLEGIEGLDEQAASELVAWASEQTESGSAGLDLDEGGSSPMADQDFMAALSRAFQESENELGAQDTDAEGAGDAAGDGSTDGAEETETPAGEDDPTVPMLPHRPSTDSTEG